MIYNLQQIIQVLKNKKYQVFEDDSKNYNLNLVGVRTADTTPDTFNDWLYMFWKFKGIWSIKEYPITTDPGLYWREHPMNVEGTGILLEGQWNGLWHIGMHQGRYEALTQNKPCVVIRDFDRDKYLDFDSAKRETGMFGLNCHGSKFMGESVQVGRWSAACQVHSKWMNFVEMMNAAKLSSSIWGNSFTYTLLNQKDF